MTATTPPLAAQPPLIVGMTGSSGAALARRAIEVLLELGQPVDLAIPKVKPWSPDTPFLYDLRVELLDGDKTVDAVDSYFVMRKIAVGKDDKGVTRLLFNGKFVFQVGPLDQP